MRQLHTLYSSFHRTSISPSIQCQHYITTFPRSNTLQRYAIAASQPFQQNLSTHVLHQKISGARMFILNRPEKLNALNLGMIRNIEPQLKAWEVSKLAKVILMKGTGSGKFCVGDDISAEVLLKVKSKDPDALYFFQEKFGLVQTIATLNTPYVAILDGYALGGATGLFVHCPFRIATEKTIFSLPEASIGAFLSSGSSFFLPKLDGETGTYLALTGDRLQGIDTFFAGIATHYVPSSRLSALEDRLIDLETSEHEIIQRVLEEFVDPVATDKIGFTPVVRETIDRCFKYDSVDEIIGALENEKSTTWIRETKKKIMSMSPTSLCVTLKTLRKAQFMSFNACLKLEFDLIQKYLVTKDFHEGVIAAFLSRPRRKPQWQPSSLEEITDDDIDQLYFNEPSPNALTLPSRLDIIDQYPYSRFALPTEDEVRRAVTGEGAEFGFEGRLKEENDVIEWFEKGHKRKWGVKEKVLDILRRKTVSTEDGLAWKRTL
ncbi:ClpP/crotonase-like domain-containing protein [Phycomyces blakesleeanus]|uniref:3-hydroxyisobutyryl-CoA hydrolase n=1 Tax=Phycomyces blakesleeanus TaxID=4837 RepID=A0ABR3ARB3_PHYBL